jgi:hypothetical protein
MEGYNDFFGRGGRPGLTGAGKGYIYPPAGGKHSSVGRQWAIKCFGFYRGLPRI